MQIPVLIFGQLTDITLADKVMVKNVANTDELLNALITQYPGLQQKKFAIAVNLQIIQKNTTIDASTSVALMPPFSGG